MKLLMIEALGTNARGHLGQNAEINQGDLGKTLTLPGRSVNPIPGTHHCADSRLPQHLDGYYLPGGVVTPMVAGLFSAGACPWYTTRTSTEAMLSTMEWLQSLGGNIWYEVGLYELRYLQDLLERLQPLVAQLLHPFFVNVATATLADLVSRRRFFESGDDVRLLELLAESKKINLTVAHGATKPFDGVVINWNQSYILNHATLRQDDGLHLYEIDVQALRLLAMQLYPDNLRTQQYFVEIGLAFSYCVLYRSFSFTMPVFHTA